LRGGEGGEIPVKRESHSRSREEYNRGGILSGRKMGRTGLHCSKAQTYVRFLCQSKLEDDPEAKNTTPSQEKFDESGN